jgi:glycosyltransferase involved in cell wall biosynthesis
VHLTTDVLQLITSTDRRGAETFAVELAAELERGRRSVATMALVPGSSRQLLPVPALGKRRLGIGTLRALRSRSRRSRVLVAHGSSTLPASVMATLGTGVPLVYRSIGDPRYWSRSNRTRLQTAALLRYAQLVVALSEEAARDLVTRVGVPEHKVTVIPNGVSARRFPAIDARGRAVARRRLGVSDWTPIAVFLGALSPEKEVGTAIAAVAKLPDVHLLVAGDGPERHALEDLAARVAPGRVKFVGATDDPAQTLAAADVVVLSSRTEGLPGVLIEAGMSALPSVTTDVGLVREIIVDGETGFVVARDRPELFADAIERAVANAPTLGGAARERCLTRFEIAVVAEAWERALDRVLAPD